MFKYDHSLLSLVDLHSKGIRSPKELEEVIEGHSFADEEFFSELGYSILKFIGFNKDSRAIKVACKLNESGKVITLDARIPAVEEIISDFCRYC